MRNSIVKNKSEEGSITVIALMLLVVLTLLGITISRTSTIDIKITANEIRYKERFYVAEGGIHREATEVGGGSYPVANLNPAVLPLQLADQNGQANGNALPAPRPGDAGYDFPDYDFTLKYLGYFLPPQGYSVIHFSRYDYDVDSYGDPAGSRIHVYSRYFKIGPKAES